MQRRDFMTLCSAAGLSLGLQGLFGRRADAAEAGQGPLYVCVHASGGWDPTAVCDPKGALTDKDENPVNRFLRADIAKVGSFRVAPLPGVKAFFDKHYARTMVINGVDTATNGHDSGTRNMWSGKLVEGYPAFAALVAASGVSRPMSFLTNGGYDTTAGLVAPTRVGNTDVLVRLAHPNRPDPNDDKSRYHSDPAAERLAAYREARLDRLSDQAVLPRLRASIATQAEAQLGRGQIAALTAALPEQLDNSGNPLKRQAQLAVAAFKSGLATSANLVIGGFDTHGNHDGSHYPQLEALFDGVDTLWTLAEDAGVADRVTVVIGSDFGRTPWYNSGNGKDHWSITSYVLLGRGVPGNRVVGLTDEVHSPIAVDPQTFAPSASGVRITPEHVHVALRQLAGITTSEQSRSFGLSAALLPLFVT